MIGWMLYCVAAATIVAGAARAAESLARVLGYRMRGIWLGALALTAWLSISSAVQRFDPPAASAVAATVRAPITSFASTGPTWIAVVRAAADRVGRALDGSLAFAATSIDHAVSSSAATYVGLAWLAISLALAALFAAISARFLRARRQWPLSRVQGVPVRVSPSVGPIVIGLVRSEIVVPRWLLHRSDDEQRLAIVHEQEHLRARDPAALGFGWFVVIAAPWNAAAWYMLSRLRLAIELDCDARVLRRGVTPRAYGSLLIEVAQNASPLTLSALGFANESSQLYQRLLALRGPVASFAGARAIVAGLVAAAGVLAACQIVPPPQLAVVREAADRRSDVGVVAPISRESLAAASPVQPAASPKSRRRRGGDGAAAIIAHVDSVAKERGPLLLIDGVRSSLDVMDGIDPKTIANVEVLKGASAIAVYGADAERGVITITTKHPPPR